MARRRRRPPRSADFPELVHKRQDLLSEASECLRAIILLLGGEREPSADDGGRGGPDDSSSCTSAAAALVAARDRFAVSLENFGSAAKSVSASFAAQDYGGFGVGRFLDGYVDGTLRHSNGDDDDGLQSPLPSAAEAAEAQRAPNGIPPNILFESLELAAAELRRSSSELRSASDLARRGLVDVERRLVALARRSAEGPGRGEGHAGGVADPTPLLPTALLGREIVSRIRTALSAEMDAASGAVSLMSDFYRDSLDGADVARRMRGYAAAAIEGCGGGSFLEEEDRWAVEQWVRCLQKVCAENGGEAEVLANNDGDIGGATGGSTTASSAVPSLVEELETTGVAAAGSDDEPWRLTDGGGVISASGDRRTTWRSRVLSAPSVRAAVDAFASRGDEDDDIYEDDCGGAVCLLISGPAGSGKTHLCDSVEQSLQASRSSASSSSSPTTEASPTPSAPPPVAVFRPILPSDLLSPVVGGAEDVMFSLFACAEQSSAKDGGGKSVVVIVDGLEHIIGGEGLGRAGGGGGGSGERPSHVQLRTRSAFLSALNHVRRQSCHGSRGSGRILVLCTASSPLDSIMGGRFDRIFRLGRPDANERIEIIGSCLLTGQGGGLIEKNSADVERADCGAEGAEERKDETDEPMASLLLKELAERTVGWTRAELAMSCSAAVLLSSSPPSYRGEDGFDRTAGDLCTRRLEYMRHSLSTIVPQSVRGGSLDGALDMRVRTGEELQLLLTRNNRNGGAGFEMPLLGVQAAEAWAEIDSVIVTPLCRSRMLDNLLYGGRGRGAGQGGSGRGASKAVCAGALLSGPPGTGKSVLALHAAAVASSIVPAVRLLDVSCTSLVHKEVGASERAIRRLFDAARAAAPCVVVLDGIETVAQVRGHDTTTEGTMDRVLSTFLIEMDGIDAADEGNDNDGDSGCRAGRSRGGIAVIGITHDPALTDPALRRPGRLDKIIHVDRPDLAGRRAIALHEIGRIPLDFGGAGFSEPKNINELADWIGTQTDGMSGAEIKALCSEATMARMREIVAMESRADAADLAEDQLNEVLVVHRRHFAAALKLQKTGRVGQQ